MFTSTLETETDLQVFVGYQFLGFFTALVLLVLARSLALPGVAFGGLVLGALHVGLFVDFRLVLVVHGWLGGGLVFCLAGATATALGAGQDGAAAMAFLSLVLALPLPRLNEYLVRASRS